MQPGLHNVYNRERKSINLVHFIRKFGTPDVTLYQRTRCQLAKINKGYTRRPTILCQCRPGQKLQNFFFDIQFTVNLS